MYVSRIFQGLVATLGDRGIKAKGEIDGAGNVVFVGMGNGKEVAIVVPDVASEDLIGPKVTELADLVASTMAGMP
jgi:hypothetical protein